MKDCLSNMLDLDLCYRSISKNTAIGKRQPRPTFGGFFGVSCWPLLRTQTQFVI